MPATRRPSMADVAAHAGVSHQTVSRVLNGHAYVRPSTRDRVLAAIEAVGYRRNHAARALATARTATVGVLTAASTHFGPASTVLAIEAAARSAGFFVSVGTLTSDDAASARAVLDQLLAQGVDGMIVVAPLEEVAGLIDAADPSVPVVVVAARPDVPADAASRYVYVDQRGGAEQAVAHLRALGHERIVHVAGPGAWYDASQRADAFAAAMRADGLEPRIEPAGGWAARDGYAAGVRIVAQLRAAGAPTAIFAANDYLAMGLLRVFWDRGLRVPDDVSVVGFDGIEGSDFLVPALTTVRQPFARLGAAATRALLDAWSGDAAAGGVVSVIPPELVVRDSTSAPRA